MFHEESKKAEGKFIVKQITKFKDLVEGQVVELLESDLCFQDKESIYQFKYLPPDSDKKVHIKPGIFLLTESTAGLILSPMELRERRLLETVSNTAKIMKEAQTFFNRLHVYERLGRPKKRSILLYSAPGLGKTASIERFCHVACEEDKGTVVMVWPTSEIEADSVTRFLSTRSIFTPECTRMLLIIEDIGGGERDIGHSRSAVDSGLLNLLDGVGMTFKLPTFIIATTNQPENLLRALADRPGRFDLMLKLNPPTQQEKIDLMEFIAKRLLTAEEKAAFGKKGTEDFSVAHLEEIVVRAELHDKTYAQVINEMIAHTKLFNSDFDEKDRRVGIGLDRE